MSELLLITSKFRVVRETVTSDGGKTKTREIIRHPGACVIVPLLDDGCVCLIRNWRIAAGQTLIELPAGTLEPPEPPQLTAERELIEETGYRAGRFEPLAEFWMSPGILRERMHVFVASELVATAPHREAGEEIEALVVDWDEALQRVFRGEVQDAKTIAALLLYEQLRRRSA